MFINAWAKPLNKTSKALEQNWLLTNLGEGGLQMHSSTWKKLVTQVVYYKGQFSVFSLRRFICNHMIQASKFSFFLLNLHYTCWWVTSALHTHTHIHVTCSIQHTALVPVTQSANYPIHIMVPPSKVTSRTSTARRHALIDTWLWMGGRCSGWIHRSDDTMSLCRSSK